MDAIPARLTNQRFRKTSLLVQKAVRTSPGIRWESQQPRFAIESYVASPPANFDPLPMAMIAIHQGKKLDATVTNIPHGRHETVSAVPYRLILVPADFGVAWRTLRGAFWFQVIYTADAAQEALRRIIGSSRTPLQVRDQLLPALARQLLELATSPPDEIPPGYAERIIDAFTAQLERISYGHYTGEIVRTPDPAINETLLYIHAHLSDKLTIQHLASLKNMSSALLRRRFHEAVGMPVHRYIIKCRVEKAHMLIEENRYSLSVIAAHCGFSSLGHMTTTFVRLLGVTPGEYRRRQLPTPGEGGHAGGQRSARE